MQLLFALIEYTEAMKKAKSTKRNSLEKIERENWSHFVCEPTRANSHFVTHARILRHNGLIGNNEDKRTKWFVTPKGYLIADVLKIEFAEAKNASRNIKTSCKELIK